VGLSKSPAGKIKKLWITVMQMKDFLSARACENPGIELRLEMKLKLRLNHRLELRLELRFSTPNLQLIYNSAREAF
jgi:hypothetical protein